MGIFDNFMTRLGARIFFNDFYLFSPFFINPFKKTHVSRFFPILNGGGASPYGFKDHSKNLYNPGFLKGALIGGFFFPPSPQKLSKSLTVFSKIYFKIFRVCPGLGFMGKRGALKFRPPFSQFLPF